MLIREFDYKHHRNLVDHLMASNGYKRLGQGGEAVVYEKDAGNVIKIIIPETGEQGPSNIGFESFLEYCRTHKGNPHLPRFVEGKETITVEGEEFHQVVMEKLQEVKDPFDIEILDILQGDDTESSLYNRFNTWDQALADIHEFIEAGGMSDATERLTQTRPWPSDAELTKRFGTFFATAKDLFKYNQFGWDLHAGNAMQRANGTLVITDPWVSY
jgi:hypothetical protein